MTLEISPHTGIITRTAKHVNIYNFAIGSMSTSLKPIYNVSHNQTKK